MGHDAGEAAGMDVTEDGDRLATDEDGRHAGSRDDAGVGGGITDASG
jgi:hypothetical protein